MYVTRGGGDIHHSGFTTPDHRKSTYLHTTRRRPGIPGIHRAGNPQEWENSHEHINFWKVSIQVLYSIRVGLHKEGPGSPCAREIVRTDTDTCSSPSQGMLK